MGFLNPSECSIVLWPCEHMQRNQNWQEGKVLLEEVIYIIWKHSQEMASYRNAI